MICYTTLIKGIHLDLNYLYLRMNVDISGGTIVPTE